MGASKWCRGLAAAALLLGLSAAVVPAAARQQDDAENRLRAALRAATVQLRSLEDQNATLQAKQADADRERQALTEKVAALEKELGELRQKSAADKAALQKSSAKVESTEASLAKWEAAYQEAADTARARDADAKRLDAEGKRMDAEAKRRDAALVQTRELKHACEAKNEELYKLGLQMLDLYDHKTFFGDLASREPITKIKRVEYENIMQNYEDKLRANELVPPSQ